MELNVKERLVLSGLLPKEANFTTLKIMRKLREALSFDEEEHKVLNFVSNGNQLTWDQKVEVLKDVVVGDLGLEMIKTELKKLDKENKLTEDNFSLYEKFVENVE